MTSASLSQSQPALGGTDGAGVWQSRYGSHLEDDGGYGKLAHEHLYWDQVPVRKQIGLITDESLPVFGAETARQVLAGI